MEKTRSLRKETAALVAKGGRRPKMVADRTLLAECSGCWVLLFAGGRTLAEVVNLLLAMYLQNVALALIKWVRSTVIFS